MIDAGQVVADYAEVWEQDHREAMECSEFEADLALGVALFRFLEVLRLRAERRATDDAQPLPRDGMSAHYARLIETAGARLAELTGFEERFGPVANAIEFRECLRQAEVTLAAWHQPRAVGSRTIPLTEDEAQQLHALCAAPPGSPGKLTIKPQAVPLAADSLLQ